MNRVIYLTGSSGYLGGYLCKEFETDGTIAKVYCPIRTKKGMTGPERLAKLLPYSKCTYVGIQEPIPDDVTNVILNAYSTRFDESLGTKMEHNVEPIFALLDQCKKHKTVQSAVFVSTAYVQPPLPYRRHAGSRLPLLLISDEEKKKASPWKSARQVYDALYAVKDDEEAVEKLIPDLHPYYKTNSYVFSKHLLEHILEEEYMKHLNICIVRPSMIAPPRTLDYGLLTKAAAPLMMQLSQLPIIFAPKVNGKPNVVFLEEVLSDIVIAMDNRCKGKKEIDLISSTGLDNDIPTMWNIAAPHIPRLMHLRDGWLMESIRSTEFWVVYLILGSKYANLLKAVYENYDFFLDHVWDFEKRHKFPVVDEMYKSKEIYLRNFAMEKKKERLLKNGGKDYDSLYMYLLAAVLVLVVGLVWKRQVAA